MRLISLIMLITLLMLPSLTHAQRRAVGVGRISKSRANIFGSYKARSGKPIGDIFRSNARGVIKPSQSKPLSTPSSKVMKNMGRSGRQARLRSFADEPKLGRATRGWFKQEKNQVARGKRTGLRMPPETELAHRRGQEARHGNSHSQSVVQAKELHRLQHRHDNNGKKQTPYSSNRK